MMLRDLLEAIVQALNAPPAVSVPARWSHLDFRNLALEDPDECVVTPASLSIERNTRGRFDYRIAVGIVRVRTRNSDADIELAAGELVAIADRLSSRSLLEHGGSSFALVSLEIGEPICSIDETIDEKSVVHVALRATYHVTRRSA